MRTVVIVASMKVQTPSVGEVDTLISLPKRILAEPRLSRVACNAVTVHVERVKRCPLLEAVIGHGEDKVGV